MRVPSAWDHFFSTRTVQTGWIVDGCSLSVLPAYLVSQSINRFCPGSYLQPSPALRGCSCPRTRLPLSGLLQPHSSPTVCHARAPPSSRLQSPLSAPACAGICAVYKSHYLSETPVATQSFAPTAALPTLSDCHRPPKLQCPPRPSPARASVPFCSMATSLWATCSLPGPVRSLF